MQTHITKKLEDLEKIKATDLGVVIGKNSFDDDGSQNYFRFQTIYKSFTKPAGDTETQPTIAWKSKGLSDEGIKHLTATGNILAPKLKWIHKSKRAVEFNGAI